MRAIVLGLLIAASLIAMLLWIERARRERQKDVSRRLRRVGSEISEIVRIYEGLL